MLESKVFMLILTNSSSEEEEEEAISPAALTDDEELLPSAISNETRKSAQQIYKRIVSATNHSQNVGA